MTTKVTLLKKPISGNRLSLYLDFYPPITHPKTGKHTRREFLNLFLYDDIEHLVIPYKDRKGNEFKVYAVPGEGEQKVKLKLTPFQRQHNKDTWHLAEMIRLKRYNELNKPEVYSGYELEQTRIKQTSEQSFTEYFHQLAMRRKGSNKDNWTSALNHFDKFTSRPVKFKDITEKFCNEFREYLLGTPSLSRNSTVSYFNKFKATLRQAYKDGLMQTDLNGRVESIKPADTNRAFLTIEELNKLAKTPFKGPDVTKKAALFSSLTGLRFGDVKALTWENLHNGKEMGPYIQFRQKKTTGAEVLPISEQALKLCGTRGLPEEKVFKGLTYSCTNNKHIKQWVTDAGINKHITFHNFRHSYATIQLSLGTDIYTVSKMLGHRSLKTTQIYAKIIDQTKRQAANRIQLDEL